MKFIASLTGNAGGTVALLQILLKNINILNEKYGRKLNLNDTKFPQGGLWSRAKVIQATVRRPEHGLRH